MGRWWTAWRARRGAMVRGSFERDFWKPTDRNTTWCIVRGAERYDRAKKEKGARNGPLGSIALEVLRLFANIVDHRTGRLDPAITYIMDRLGRSRDAVCRAIGRLVEHGFLTRVRRYVATDIEGAGPQVKQTSNAYRLHLPEAVAALMPPREAPVPDDDMQRRAEHEAADKAMVKTLSLPERAADAFDAHDKLGQALARLGGGIERRQRESVQRTGTALLSESSVTAVPVARSFGLGEERM